MASPHVMIVLAAFTAVAVSAAKEAIQMEDALAMGEECGGGLAEEGGCALHALQLRAGLQRQALDSVAMAQHKESTTRDLERKRQAAQEDAAAQQAEGEEIAEGSSAEAPQQVGAIIAMQKREAEENGCSPVEQWCGNRGPETTCCGRDDRCVPAGNIYKCKKDFSPSPSPSSCAQEGEWCGSRWAEKACCNNQQCTRNGNEYRCNRGGGMCKHEGEVCGGYWGASSQCCGNGRCERLLGGDGTMKCTRSCVPSHEKCGGPGLRDEICCSGQCKKYSWWDEKKICT